MKAPAGLHLLIPDLARKNTVSIAVLMIFALSIVATSPASAQARKAGCKTSFQTYRVGAEPGKLLNPYQKRLTPNGYTPLAYVVGSNSWRTMTIEGRLPAQKSYSACKRILKKCFSTKVDKDLKEYRYCLKVNSKGKISKILRVR